MTDCPTYLSITINSRIDLEELFRYDLLILCPTDFYIQFTVPNWGGHPDKTFDIHLEDAQHSYYIYLTQMIFEEQRMETNPERISQVQAGDRMSVAVTVYAIVGGVTSICLVLLFFVYMYSEFSKKKVLQGAYTAPKAPSVYTDQGSIQEDQSSSICSPIHSLSQGQTCFIGIYIIFRIVYSLIFTFTVFFAILMLLVEADFKNLSTIKTFQGLKQNSSADLAGKINQYGQTELLRQGELVTSMQGACSHYIGELFTSMAEEMDNITSSQHLADMHGNYSSISYFMHQRVQKILEKYQSRIDEFRQAYNSNVSFTVEPSMTHYSHYLRDIFINDWFSFPQKLFNDSEYSENRPQVLQEKTPLSGIHADFASFLEIEEIEKVQLWTNQLWEK